MAGRFQEMPLLCLLWCYITASLLALSPARNGKQWAGCATRSSARLAKSAAVFHAIVPHNRRIIQPTVTHSSQSGSHKRTPGCVDKKNVGHKGSTGAIWLMKVTELWKLWHLAQAMKRNTAKIRLLAFTSAIFAKRKH